MQQPRFITSDTRCPADSEIDLRRTISMSKGVKVNARVKGRALSHRDRIPLGIEIPPDDICSSDTSPMRFTGVLFFRRLRIEYSSDGYIFFLSLMMYDYPARLLICLNTVRERGVRWRNRNFVSMESWVRAPIGPSLLLASLHRKAIFQS